MPFSRSNCPLAPLVAKSQFSAHQQGNSNGTLPGRSAITTFGNVQRRPDTFLWKTEFRPLPQPKAVAVTLQGRPTRKTLIKTAFWLMNGLPVDEHNDSIRDSLEAATAPGALETVVNTHFG